MTDIATPREVIFYRDDNDREPWSKWLNGLQDPKARRWIMRCMHKLKQGIYGDHKRFREIIELRSDSGPGYRVYLGEHGNKIVMLLGGDKDSQEKDIQRAEGYWKEYKNSQKLQ